MTGGLINGIKPDVAYYHFRDFIFTAVFIYFFAKAAFNERYGIAILRGLCFMALVVCIFGIIEFFTKQNFIYREFVSNFCYESFKGKRMMSTHMHPAPLGTYLVAIFPLTIILIVEEKKIFFRLLAIISTLIIFISIILTFSRGAFLGAFAGILILLFYLFRRRIIFFTLALILLAALIIAISTLLSYNKYYYFSRLGLQGLSILPVYANKIDRLISIWKILKDHPFFGLGLGQYRFLFDHYLPHMANNTNQLNKVPDCMYIALLAETGLVGFAGFILFISCAFRRILKKLKMVSGHEARLLLAGFLSGFVAILCTFLTYDALYWTAPSYLFWSYAGILSYLACKRDIS